MRLSLSQRLARLNDQRSALMAKREELLKKHKSAEVVERDLVLVTAKVLKFERKAEKVK